MHIVLTVNAAWNVWNFRRPLVAALIADGHRVTVLAPPDEAVPRLVEAGAQFVPLAMEVHSWSPLSQLRLWREYRRQFRRLAPDVVLGFTIKNNVFGALAAKLAGIAFIPNITGLGTLFLGSKARFAAGCALYRLAFARLPVVLIQNRDDRALLLRHRLVSEDRLRLVPGSGIDLDHFQAAPLPPGPTRTFLFIGRMLRDKGVLEYLEAARLCRARGAPARFRLLGKFDADQGSALTQAEIAPHVAAGDVEYLGTTDDVRGAIGQVHCVVLPSYREGAPRALLEAAAMARPLVATDVPGCREVVDHAATGLLCAARDPQALAAAMAQIAAMDDAALAAMGASGRRKLAAQYSAERVSQIYRQAIDEVARGGRHEATSRPRPQLSRTAGERVSR